MFDNIINKMSNNVDLQAFKSLISDKIKEENTKHTVNNSVLPNSERKQQQSFWLEFKVFNSTKAKQKQYQKQG